MKTVEMEINRHRSTQGPANAFSRKPHIVQPAVRKPAHWLYTLSLLLVMSLYGAGSSLNAADSLAAADSIFRFQSTMAERGHVASQYALAYMYESGQGTDKDLDKATHWYRQAAQQNYLPAKDRLVYIDILNNGYQPQLQQQWLLTLKQTADDYDHKHQGESAFLLAQLYAAGLGVNKSLSMAIRYLHLANADNVIGSDSEIRRVEAELEALRETYKPTNSDASQDPGQDPAQNTGKQPVDKTSTIKKQQTSATPAQSSANKSTAVKRIEPPVPRPAPQPVRQTKPADKPADKTRAAASTAATKNAQATTTTARPQPAPATNQNSKSEQPEPHPMQVICSGWQRLDSACR